MVIDKLEPEKIRQLIEQAFLPDTTVAELYDFNYRLRFQVRSLKDSNVILYTMRELLVHDAQTQAGLTEHLNLARDAIQEAKIRKGLAS